MYGEARARCGKRRRACGCDGGRRCACPRRPRLAPNLRCVRATCPKWHQIQVVKLPEGATARFGQQAIYTTRVWCHSRPSTLTQREFGAILWPALLHNGSSVPTMAVGSCATPIWCHPGPPCSARPRGVSPSGPAPAAGSGLLQNAGGPPVVPRALPSRSRSVRAGATCLSRSPYPSGWWQAAMWPPPRSRSSGLSCLQTSVQ